MRTILRLPQIRALPKIKVMPDAIGVRRAQVDVRADEEWCGGGRASFGSSPMQRAASGGRALCAEADEAWLEDNRYINMDLLREQRKEQLRKAA